MGHGHFTYRTCRCGCVIALRYACCQVAVEMVVDTRMRVSSPATGGGRPGYRSAGLVCRTALALATLPVEPAGGRLASPLYSALDPIVADPDARCGAGT